MYGAVYCQIILIFLALMEADDHFEQYIVNGNRILSWPGKYDTAGTNVKYSRVNDTETFEIKGPTEKDLYIMVSRKISESVQILHADQLVRMWTAEPL